MTRWRLIEGDCVQQMAQMPDASVDAVVCDPPYGLNFMGSSWDSFGRQRVYEERTGYKDCGVLPGYGRGGTSSDREKYHRRQNYAMQEWHEAWAQKALRVLKPGGHLLAFGGTRTFHRLACAIEDAGFEVRDTICWLYGSGFPKSLDVSKAIDRAAGAEREIVGRSTNYRDPTNNSEHHERWNNGVFSPDVTVPATPEAKRWQGWGTALKPSHEPIVVARKPLAGTVADNVLKHGTGALNIDGCRIGYVSEADQASAIPQGQATAKPGALAGGTQKRF